MNLRLVHVAGFLSRKNRQVGMTVYVKLDKVHEQESLPLLISISSTPTTSIPMKLGGIGSHVHELFKLYIHGHPNLSV